MLFEVIVQFILTAILCILAFASGLYALQWYKRVNRTKWIHNTFYKRMTVLEIKLPREIDKSPQAMEFVLNAMYQVGDLKVDYKSWSKVKHWTDWLKNPFKHFENVRKWIADGVVGGKTPAWFSLEIASLEGQIHFYIVTVEKYKQIISSYIYSQYPGIEVVEVEDYLNHIRPKVHGGEYDLYTSYFPLSGPDYLPIKTYVAYGLDKDPKEEYKIDPLVPLIESMASVGKGENVIYQILAVATRDDHWKNDAKKRIDKILQITRDEKGQILEQKKTILNLTPKEKNELEMIQQNIQKPGFDCHIRVVYACNREDNPSISNFFQNQNDQIVRNAMKSFDNQDYNTFKVEHQNSSFPQWQDYKDMRRMKRKRATWFYIITMRAWFFEEMFLDGRPWYELVQKYKKYGFRTAWEHFRGDIKDYYFVHDRMHGGYNVFNAEELATLYHFPGKVLSAPNFDRVRSNKGDAPANLPI